MNTNKLSEIIAEQNERRESEALHQAGRMINQIVKEQQIIRTANEQITKLRKELQELGVEQLDAAEVLGGDA